MNPKERGDEKTDIQRKREREKKKRGQRLVILVSSDAESQRHRN